MDELAARRMAYHVIPRGPDGGILSDELENPVGQLHRPVGRFLEMPVFVADAHFLILPHRIGVRRKLQGESDDIHLVEFLPDRIQQRLRIPACPGNEHQDLRRGRIGRLREVVIDIDRPVGERLVSGKRDDTASRLEKRSRQALHGHQEAAGKQEEGSVHLRISLCEAKG